MVCQSVPRGSWNDRENVTHGYIYKDMSRKFVSQKKGSGLMTGLWVKRVHIQSDYLCYYPQNVLFFLTQERNSKGRVK